MNIEQSEIQEVIDEEHPDPSGKIAKAITVKVINMAWFLNDGHKYGFLNLCKVLDLADTQSIFVSDFVNYVLQEFWDQYYNKLFYQQFLPYLLCISVTIFYMGHVLSRVEIEGEESSNTLIKALGGFNLALLAYEITHEVICFRSADSILDHFASIWNINDLLWMTLTPFFVIITLPSQPLIDKSTSVVIASVASFSMMIKILDWMRLFDATAFFVHLIKMTFKEIGAFLLLLLVTLMMFGVPLAMLALDNLQYDEENASDIKRWLPNLIFTQYMLALGEFNSEFEEMSFQKWMCYVFFLLATFISLIMMLNMLIAIMGDTFERTIENRQLNNTRTKIELMGEQTHNIIDFSCFGKKDEKSDQEKTYLFVITPDEADIDENDSWEGSIKQMSKLNQQYMDAKCDNLSKQITDMKDQLDTFSKRDEAQDKNLKKSINQQIRSL